MKRVLIILFLLVVVPMTTFAQTMREEQGSVKIYFRVSETTIDEAYKGNGESLNRFAEIINACKEDKDARVGVISVTASTSPEGTKAINDRIAKQRAKAITDWLKAKTSAELTYNIKHTRTDWDLLISEVIRRNDVPCKQELLDIMRNTPEFTEVNGRIETSRLAELKSLYNYAPYNWLLKNIFPDMRYTAASTTISWELRKTLAITSESPMNFAYTGGNGTIKFKKSVADDIIPTVTCDAEWIGSIKATESSVNFVVAENTAHKSRTATIVLHYGESEHSVEVNQEPAPIQKSEPAQEPTSVEKVDKTSKSAAKSVTAKKDKKPFYMAIKTNMLYDAIAIPNLGVEFNLGKGFSLMANYTHSWWNNESKNFFWRYYGAEASLRWWFGKRARIKPLQGHHIGVNYQMMTYDFQLGKNGVMAGKPGGTLIDRPNHSVSLEYGYSLPVARRLNIDFVIGAGYHWGIFEEYIPIDGHFVWQSTKRRQYFGPTKAEISLVWLIGHGNYNKDKGKKKEAKR